MQHLHEDQKSSSAIWPHLEEERKGILHLAEDSIDELIKRHASEAALKGLETQLDRRSKFLSLVSHDLRSPMAIGKICADMIAFEPNNPELCKSRALRIGQ